MFSNIGNTSFILYGVFISITIITMLLAFRFIKKGYPDLKLDKMIELFKYAIVTVAIATVTLIVSDLFKERELELKELEYFGKYVDDVRKADGLQSRFELTRYLSIVAPSGELKKSWQRYYDTLRIEFQEYTRLKKEKEALDSIKRPTQDQLVQKQQLNEKIQQKNVPLAGNENPFGKFIPNTLVECWIHFADTAGYPIARNLTVKISPVASPKHVITFMYNWSDYKSILLAPGKYEVSVDFDGGTYTQQMTVKKGMDQPIVFGLATANNL